MNTKIDYVRKYSTEEYVVDFSDMSIYIKKTGEVAYSSWEVLDYLKRDYWRNEKCNRTIASNEISINKEIKDTEGILLEECLADSKTLSPTMWLDKEVEQESFNELISILPLRKANIIKKMFLEEKSGAEISKEEKVTKEAVYKARKEAMAKIKEAVLRKEMEKEM